MHSILNVINLDGWAMSQKLPVNNFEQTEDTSRFNEDFKNVRTIMKKVMKDIFLKLIFNIPKNYINFIMIHNFYQKQ